MLPSSRVLGVVEDLQETQIARVQHQTGDRPRSQVAEVRFRRQTLLLQLLPRILFLRQPMRDMWCMRLPLGQMPQISQLFERL